LRHNFRVTYVLPNCRADAKPLPVWWRALGTALPPRLPQSRTIALIQTVEAQPCLPRI
jgi:hypothetical protein